MNKSGNLSINEKKHIKKSVATGFENIIWNIVKDNIQAIFSDFKRKIIRSVDIFRVIVDILSK